MPVNRPELDWCLSLHCPIVGFIITVVESSPWDCQTDAHSVSDNQRTATSGRSTWQQSYPRRFSHLKRHWMPRNILDIGEKLPPKYRPRTFLRWVRSSSNSSPTPPVSTAFCPAPLSVDCRSRFLIFNTLWSSRILAALTVGPCVSVPQFLFLLQPYRT